MPRRGQGGHSFDGEVDPFLGGEAGQHDRAAPAGGPAELLGVGRHGMDVRGLDVASGAGLHPAGQLAGDGGHHRCPLEDRTGQRARHPAAAEERRVGPVHREHAGPILGEREPGGHPPVGMQQVGGGGLLAGGAAEGAPESGQRAEPRGPRRADCMVPAIGEGLGAGPRRSAPGAPGRRRSRPRLPCRRRSARPPAPRRPRRTSAAARVARKRARQVAGESGESCG